MRMLVIALAILVAGLAATVVLLAAVGLVAVFQ